MQIRIVGTANTTQARAQMAALTAQVERLNGAMAQTSMIPKGGSPAGYARTAAAARDAGTAWSTAMSASGAYRVEQLRINDAVSKHTELLQRQKLGFNQVFGKKSRNMMREVYREQLRLQNAQMMMTTGGIGDGKMRANMAIPTGFIKSWDTASARVGFFRQRLASASSELINWGKNTQWAGRQLMAGITMPVAAFGAAAGIMAYKVDAAMAKITKVYDFSAEAQMNAAKREEEAAQLRVDSLDNARIAAVKYGASITETLDVQQQLAATGMSGSSLMRSTNQVQRFSVLGDIDPTQTTDMIVALQTAFRKTIRDGDDLERTLNFMNAASNATSLSLQDIAEATPRAASALSSLGVTAEEMTVLLVSMRENGVNAAEGANALKSATTRILNPVKKAVALYDKYNINIKALSQQSGGNLFDFLKILGKEQQKINGQTEEQTQYLRAQGIATLFGTYQYNRLNASLVNLSDAYGGVQNQSAKALDLMGLSTEELAKRADNSLKDITDTASGRFKQAFETLKADLAGMGDPFLNVATVIVKAIGTIIAMMNKLPSAAKHGLIFALILGAIVGPVVMLIGLFANFAGNIGKFAAFLMRATTSWRMMDKAQWAAKVSADLAAKGFQQETSASEVLTTQIRAQTLAIEQMVAAYSRMPGVRPVTAVGGVPAMTGAPIIPGQYPVTTTPGGPTGPVLAGTHVPGLPTGSAVPLPYPAGLSADAGVGGRKGKRAFATRRDLSAQVQGQSALATAQERQAKAALATERSALRQTSAQAALAQQTDRTKNNLNGANLAMGAMGIAMGGIMLSSGAAEGSWRASVGHFSKWLLIAAIVIPAVKILVTFMVAAAAATTTFLSGLVMSTISYTLLNVQAAGQLTLLTAMKAGALGFGRALYVAMGPVGVITLGLVAMAGVLFTINRHNKAIEEAQRRQMGYQTGLTNQAQEWADTQEEAIKSWRRFQDMKISAEAQKQFDTDVEWYKSDEQKNNTEAYNKLSPEEQDGQLMLKYVNSIKEVGLSATEAKDKLVAFLFATGMGLDEAKSKAQEFQNEIGSGALSANEWMKLFDKGLINITNTLSTGNVDNAKALGLQTGKMFMEGLLDPKNTINQRNQMLANLQQSVMEPWEEIAAKVNALRAEAPQENFLSPLLGDTGEDMVTAEQLREKFFSGDKKERQQFMAEFYSVPRSVDEDWNMLIDNAEALERALYGGAAQAQGLGDDIDTMGEFMSSDRIAAMSQTFEEANTQVAGIKKGIEEGSSIDFSGMVGMFGLSVADTETLAGNLEEAHLQTALASQKAYNLQFGFKIASENLSPAEQYAKNLYYWINKTVDKTLDADAAVDAMMHKLKDIDRTIAINISLTDSTDILREGMVGVQSDLSDAITNDFENDMESAIDRQEKYWDNRIGSLEDRQDAASDRMDDRHEREQTAFENRWKNRIGAVEAEIEAEKKAEEIRQRIFEAEQTRLDRLTESSNRTIDFNMAMQTGDIDEAAKIRNDMDAAAQEWALSDGAATGAKGSEKRVEGLEAEIQTLEDREEIEKKAMEDRQENEKEHLKKIQEMNMENLRELAEQRKKEYQAEWDAKKDSLEDQLELFKSFVPKNQKQLENWMDKMDITYERFGLDILKPKSDRWGKWYRKSLTDNIAAAGYDVANDNMWEKLGGDMAKATLNGMGFTLASFKKFIATGELPSGFGKPIKPDNEAPAGTPRSPGDKGYYLAEPRHTGGIVGGSGGGRNGVARTTKGLHRSEQMVLAQKGEFMVNRDSAKKYAPQLNAINKGAYNPMGGAGLGFAGLIAGAIGPAFAMGVSRSLMSAASGAYAPGTAGSYTAGSAGAYGNTNFDAEQLANAATIASVGSSMGMSARDISIGIMTAITESMLRNIHGGDRDSQGLFQQRPSQGWGTVAQVTDPNYAARKFFEALKGVTDRNNMTPWAAAQAVQRSAFSDGSNYKGYWDEGQAIFASLTAAPTGELGPGGLHAPINAKVSNGLHDTGTDYPAVDFSTPRNTPVFAVADGKIVRSEDIRGPLSTDRYDGDGPYGSYGKVMVLKTDIGPEVLYAHLNSRYFQAGERVTGGTQLGLSGNTGNSSGPHLHFGATDDPMNWVNGRVSGRGPTGSVEGWGKETTPVDPATAGYWTYISGMMDAVAKASTAKSVSSAVPGSIRSGTYNLGTGSNEGTKTDLLKLMGLADVLSLSEMSSNKRALIPWIESQNWGFYASRPGPALAWNKDAYNMSGAGERPLSKKGTSAHRYGVYGKFSGNGDEFWQIAAHAIAWPYKNAGRRSIQAEQFKNLRGLWGDLHKGGLPVILGGDMNEDIQRGNWIKQIGLDNYTKSGPGTHPIHGVEYLDHLMSIGLTPGEMQTIQGLSSDHNALVNTFSIPSHKNGAENVRWDNTLVNLHKKESVLTADQSDKFRRLADNIDNVAGGRGNEYNIKVEVNNPAADANDIARTVLRTLEKSERRKPTRRVS